MHKPTPSDGAGEPSRLFEEGVAHQQQGRLADAARVYDAVLGHDPGHFFALHLLGDLRARQGALAEAEGLIRRAIAANPDSAEAHYNLGNTLHRLGRHEAAIAHYARAIALKPGYVRAHNNFGNAKAALGRHGEAIECYERVLELAPDDAEAQYNLGVALQALGRHEEAIPRYRRAVAARPDFADACNNLGNAYECLGLDRQAAAGFAQAIAMRPGFAEAHYNLGNALQRLDRYAEAAAAYEDALALRPNQADAHNNLGAALKVLGRWDAALAHYEQALALEPDNAAAHNNLANLLQALNRVDEAIAHYERALAIRPDYAEALSHYGTALKALNRHEEALERHEAAVALRPDYAEGQLNLGLLRLAMGDYAAGWRQYEWRWRSGGWGARRRDVPQPVWLGQDDPAGRTILLYAEQGFGDTIQFVRYAPLLAARGATVVLEVQRPLVRLLAGIDGVAGVHAAGDALPAYDRHCPMSSLPLAFATTLATVPAAIPYLAPPGDSAARWRKAIVGTGGGLRVGLVWAGNLEHNNDRNRSLPGALLRPLLETPGIRFFALQKELRHDDAIGALDNVTLLGDELADFAETAAAIAALDLVITVDTAVAHLAGALGKPVWLLLPFAAEWRWLRDREDSPWYPSARLFRQSAPGDWEGVIRRVRRQLDLLRKPPR